MQLETDVIRVEELAAENEEANWEFRCYLKGWCDLPSEEIDALVHDFFHEVARQIDCQKCANCCKKVHPLLKSKDVRRLASHLGISPEAFAEEYLVASKRDDGFHFKTLPCPFLKDNRCTVYASRPHDCRSYPHLHKRDFIFRINQAFANCSICPIVYNVYELLKDALWDDKWVRDEFDYEYE